MTPLQELLRRIASDLRTLERDWALVGGLAVSARSVPRFTADIDVAVSVSGDDDAETLSRALGARGWRIVSVVEQERTGRLATVRLTAGDQEAPVVDVLFASSGLEPEIVAAAERLDVFPGQSIPVATVGHLIALKLLARHDTRPQDDVDLRALGEVAGPADRALVCDALETIQQRGYGRGRDLVAMWAALGDSGSGRSR